VFVLLASINSASVSFRIRDPDGEETREPTCPQKKKGVVNSFSYLPRAGDERVPVFPTSPFSVLS
jgi:hypothetical protein